MQKVFGYLNTQMVDQSHFHGLKRAKRYIKAVNEMSSEIIHHFAESTSNFSQLSNKACQIYDKIAGQEEDINSYILQDLIIPKSPGKYE